MGRIVAFTCYTDMIKSRLRDVGKQLFPYLICRWGGRRDQSVQSPGSGSWWSAAVWNRVGSFGQRHDDEC